MTRVNAGIHPAELPNNLLLAELREIKRIPNAVKKRSVPMKFDRLPPTFVLGKGHVTFFYNKLGYLLQRYAALRAEALRRGLNVQDFSGAWHGVNPKLMNDWNETALARRLVLDRIASKGITLRSL